MGIYVTNSKDIDISMLARAAIAYYNILQQHCRGDIQLPPESIKFFSERLLENVLMIEEEAEKIYDSFTPEEKEELQMQEYKRNSYYSDGTEIDAKAKSYAEKFLASIDKRYKTIHENAEARVKDSGESDD